MSSICSDALVMRQGLVQFLIGDVAALLGASDQLLDGGVVEVDQRRIATVASISGVSFFAMLIRRLIAGGEGRQPFVWCLPSGIEPLSFGKGFFIAVNQPLGDVFDRIIKFRSRKRGFQSQVQVCLGLLRVSLLTSEREEAISARLAELVGWASKPSLRNMVPPQTLLSRSGHDVRG